METPDRWIVIKINDIEKVFASWYGGYANAPHWRLNSGIERTEENDEYFYFHGYSGSCYECKKSNEGVAGMFNKAAIEDIMKKIKDSGNHVEIINKTK